ncbi:MAG TPA: cobyric acid synthase, partial [Solirubrobacteraceae bacterium]|nr:cobyric acid synthase [Solirubrobacteraceae bacterium]
LCRWLARQGVRVAPFKAQNMALNSAVTADGAEIGRAQAMQAAAAGIESEAAMNPVLLKPGSETRSQVVLLGQPVAEAGALDYQELKPVLQAAVAGSLADLRRRFDVVICEGAGSPAEINLRDRDIANMGLARAADLPVIVVGDIDRGGVLAAMYGTLAVLDPADQRHIAGFVINKFRGDQTILAPGLDDLERLTGRPTLGVLPFVEDLWMDVEDSLSLDASRPEQPAAGTDTLDVAVVRLRYISNFTDADALSAEPGVRVRFTRSAADIERADLVIVPGTKATVEDLERLRATGLDHALRARAQRGDPIFGICGGYQLLGERIHDEIESRRGTVAGLGLLPANTRFEPDKILRRRTGHSPWLGTDASGYEIRHGRVERTGGSPLIDADEGCVNGAVAGTSWHGVLERDDFRRAYLARVAAARRRRFVPGNTPFAAVRAAHLDVLGDLVANHIDTATLERLIEAGPPAGLPTIDTEVRRVAALRDHS